MIVSRLVIAAATSTLLFAGAAQADDIRLTSAEYTTVAKACETGLPLIPVESDFGMRTGQYALPISEDDGDVHSALIVDEASLRTIPECSAEVEDAIAEREQDSERRAS
ncbi:MAG: hypothetical protein RIB03_01165 [Henriciella sp.]|uniref:hypothetical protein n=1 Tax=Henriciella sp. TaxID=1968823 RepID=UPI00262F2E48|nr:hypothetical protein [Henriciella sp.]